MAEPFAKIKMDGFKEVQKALWTLDKAVGRSVLRSAIKKAGQPVLDSAQANAPVLTGDLKASIAFKSALTKRQRIFSPKMKDEVELFIGPTHPKGRHGHLLEFGTSKMPAQPFLRPAWDANKDHVLNTLEKEIWNAIERVQKRLAAKAAAGPK